MTLSAEVIDAMLESGCTAEQLATVMKAAIKKQEEEIKQKRESARLRKQKQRDRESGLDDESHTMSRDVTVTKKQKEKRTKKEKIKNNIYISPCIPQNLWDEFSQMRKDKKKPLTERTARGVLKKIDDLQAKGFNPPNLLQTAIDHEWLTVYEPKEETHAKPSRNNKKSNNSAEQQRLEALREFGVEDNRF